MSQHAFLQSDQPQHTSYLGNAVRSIAVTEASDPQSIVTVGVVAPLCIEPQGRSTTIQHGARHHHSVNVIAPLDRALAGSCQNLAHQATIAFMRFMYSDCWDPLRVEPQGRSTIVQSVVKAYHSCMGLGQSQAWTIWIPGNSRARFSCGCSRWRYSMSPRVLRRISRSGRCGGGKEPR
eukprot:scaffold5174_cov118-Isochrysis_galbana.AAC.12